MARDEIAEIEAVLSDPIAVHVNMMRGVIAKPSIENIIHLYGRDALLASLRSQDREDGLIAFAREMIQCAFDGMSVDGDEIQAVALSHGLLRETVYDPGKHGASMETEPGDEWYELAGPLALPLRPAQEADDA